MSPAGAGGGDGGLEPPVVVVGEGLEGGGAVAGEGSVVPSVPPATSARGAAPSQSLRAPDSSASQCPNVTQRIRSTGMTLARAAETDGKSARGPVWKRRASSPVRRNWLKVNPPAIASVCVESRKTPAAISSSCVSIFPSLANRPGADRRSLRGCPPGTRCGPGACSLGREPLAGGGRRFLEGTRPTPQPRRRRRKRSGGTP